MLRKCQKNLPFTLNLSNSRPTSTLALKSILRWWHSSKGWNSFFGKGLDMFSKLFPPCYERRREWKLITSAGWIEGPAVPSMDFLLNVCVFVCVCEVQVVWSKWKKEKCIFQAVQSWIEGHMVQIWTLSFEYNVWGFDLFCKRYKYWQAIPERLCIKYY